MATIKQETGDYEIVASGSAFTFKSNPLKIAFTDSAVLTKVDISGGALNLEINFKEDTSQDGKII